MLRAMTLSKGRQVSHIIAPGMLTKLSKIRNAGLPSLSFRAVPNDHPHAALRESPYLAKWTAADAVFCTKILWSVRQNAVAMATTSCAWD